MALPLGTRRRIAAYILVVTAIILSLSIFAAQNISSQYRQLELEWRYNAEREVQAMATSIETALDAFDSSLRLLADVFRVRGEDQEVLSRSLRSIEAFSQDLVRTFLILNSQGVVILDSREDAPAVGLNVSDREYFYIHNETFYEGPYFAEPVSSRVDGAWSIPISLAVRDSDNSLLGMIVASLDPAYFERFAALNRNFNTGESGVIIFISTAELTIISSIPYNPEYIGRRYVYQPGEPQPNGMELQIDYPVSEFLQLHFSVQGDDTPDLARLERNTLYWIIFLILGFLILSAGSVYEIRSRLKLYYSNQKLKHETKLRSELLDQLQNSFDEREHLYREVSHRTRNSLSMVAALLHLKAEKNIDQPSVRGLISDTEHRIKAMSVAYDLLDEGFDQASLDLRVLIDKYAEYVGGSVGNMNLNLHLDWSVEAATISLDQAMPILLILHELVSNSLNHGFAGITEGTIGLSIISSNSSWELRYTDNGIGLDEPELQNVGSGIAMVNDIAEQQLSAEIRWLTGNEPFSLYLKIPISTIAEIRQDR